MNKVLEWTPNRVRKFWDFWATDSYFHDQYFAKQVGEEVIRFVEFERCIEGQLVLDYGCGPGYLVECLLSRKSRVIAADSSPDSLSRVASRFAECDEMEAVIQIVDGRTSIDDGSIDITMCIETVEHVDDTTLRNMLSEFHRVLSDDGIVFVTTPNSENLEHSKCYCPDCDHVFHRVQHVRNWTPHTLQSHFESQGFEPVLCTGVNFSTMFEPTFRRWKDCSFRDISLWTRLKLAAVLDTIAPRRFPNGRSLQRLINVGHSPHLVGIFKKK